MVLNLCSYVSNYSFNWTTCTSYNVSIFQKVHHLPILLVIKKTPLHRAYTTRKTWFTVVFLAFFSSCFLPIISFVMTKHLPRACMLPTLCAYNIQVVLLQPAIVRIYPYSIENTKPRMLWWMYIYNVGQCTRRILCKIYQKLVGDLAIFSSSFSFLYHDVWKPLWICDKKHVLMPHIDTSLATFTFNTLFSTDKYSRNSTIISTASLSWQPSLSI